MIVVSPACLSAEDSLIEQAIKLSVITGDYYRLLEITIDYCRILEITIDYWRLLEMSLGVSHWVKQK